MLESLNYVNQVEILVVAAIITFAVYIAYTLDLFRKG